LENFFDAVGHHKKNSLQYLRTSKWGTLRAS
jgi:hypothetical protein